MGHATRCARRTRLQRAARWTHDKELTTTSTSGAPTAGAHLGGNAVSFTLISPSREIKCDVAEFVILERSAESEERGARCCSTGFSLGPEKALLSFCHCQSQKNDATRETSTKHRQRMPEGQQTRLNGKTCVTVLFRPNKPNLHRALRQQSAQLLVLAENKFRYGIEVTKVKGSPQVSLERRKGS